MSEVTEVSFTVCEVEVKLRKNENETRNEVKITDTSTRFTQNIPPERLASCVNAEKSEDVAGAQVTGSGRQVNDGRREKSTTRRDVR